MSVANTGHPGQSRTQEISWPDLPLGIGTGRICSLNGGLPLSKASQLLHQAYDLGIRFVDTAPSYGQGQAEEAIGRLDRSIREELIVCTKVGYSLGRKGQVINLAKPIVQPILPWVGGLRKVVASTRQRADKQGGSMTVSIEPAAIRSNLEGSLRRLQLDRIELYLMHDPSLESVEDESNQRQLADLVAEGKIRHWGISTSDGQVARRAAAVPGCDVIEMPGYPAWVEANRAAMQACAEHRVAMIANGVMTPLTRAPHGDSEPGPPQTASQCIEYAHRLPECRLVLCGARNVANLQSNVNVMRQLLVG